MTQLALIGASFMRRLCWAIALTIAALPTTATLSGRQVAPAQAPSIDDAKLWAEFQQWVEMLAHVPLEQRRADRRSSIEAAYVAWLVSRGVSKPEATARYARINTSRRGSIERERVFWNAAWKLGAGPDHPLPLLVETVKGLKPGRALVPGMGEGRNALYLASLGWDVTGYDNAQSALTAAHVYATQAHLSMKMVLASHDEFDYGVEQWDLIVNSFNYVDPVASEWPPRVRRALRPGGLIVWQTGGPAAASVDYAAQIASVWRQFRILRLEQPDGKGDDWLPNQPFVRVVLKKPTEL